VQRVGLRILFVFVVMAHDRRRVIHFNVTAHPTAEWTAQQIAEAFPGTVRPDICCTIEMRFTENCFRIGCGRWGSARY
jgi:hypothetical protein